MFVYIQKCDFNLLWQLLLLLYNEMNYLIELLQQKEINGPSKQNISIKIEVVDVNQLHILNMFYCGPLIDARWEKYNESEFWALKVSLFIFYS